MNLVKSPSEYLDSSVHHTGEDSIYTVINCKVLEDFTSPNDKVRVLANTQTGVETGL